MTEREQEFQILLSRTRGVAFLGIAKYLGVEIDTDQKDEKDRAIGRAAEDILNDVIAAFSKSNRTQQRRLLKMMRSAWGGAKQNDANSEDKA